MSKVRQVIKLYFQQMGKRKIGERLGMSKHTVKFYIDYFHSLHFSKDELFKLSDFELNKLFHPPKEILLNDRLKQLYDFFPVVKKQLSRRGMTLSKQFMAFKELHPESLGETSFYYHYNLWCKKVNPTMHMEHTVGDKMYVDFAGATLSYVDKDTGEIKAAQIFVAILGWSQYAYVEAMQSQTIEDFVAACEHALYYFKGVPLAIVPDNLKSAVLKASNYEPTVNENFKAFADHYGIAILPARSRKPQDKAHVENMVKLSYQKIYTNIPEKEILSLEELNRQIKQHLAALNDATLTGKECSRTDQWMMELPSLHPLAATAYEMRKIKQVTVMKNGHIYLTEDQHYYSVPYELIGKKLKLQYSRSQVDLYLNYELIATHKRIRSPHNYTTDPLHMPAQHRYVTEWSPSFFMEKAKKIDPVVKFHPCSNEFENASTCIDQFVWVLPDSSISTVSSPIYKFTKPGTYHAKLTVKKGIASDSVSKEIKIAGDSLHYPDPTFTFKMLSKFNILFQAIDTVETTYSWSFGDGTYDDTSGYKITHYFNLETYRPPVTLWIYSGCGVANYAVDPYLATAIKEEDFLSLNSIIFPNPAIEELNVSIKNLAFGKHIITRLVNENGSVIKMENSTTTSSIYNWKYNTYNLPKGLYLIQIIVDGYELNRKVIIQ